MNQQLDMLGMLIDDAATRRIGLPQPREVKRRRLPSVLVDVPRAANADPETSHIAADMIRDSGALATQQQLVLNAVRQRPGSTSAELAEYLALVRSGTRALWREERPMVARRLPELATFHVKRGDARECRVTGSKCVTWWPL